MKWLGLLFLALFVSFVSTTAVEAQTITIRVAKHCSDRETATVPSQVLEDLGKALKVPDRQESSKRAIEIAKKPGSGLKVSFDQKPGGTIVSYFITPAAIPGCTIAMMHFQAEQR